MGFDGIEGNSFSFCPTVSNDQLPHGLRSFRSCARNPLWQRGSQPSICGGWLALRILEKKDDSMTCFSCYKG